MGSVFQSLLRPSTLRLVRFFGLSQGYWLRAQNDYDLEVARHGLGEQLEAIHPWAEAI